jgi:hypothetical protein
MEGAINARQATMAWRYGWTNATPTSKSPDPSNASSNDDEEAAAEAGD